jgi:hypothetical protein
VRPITRILALLLLATGLVVGAVPNPAGPSPASAVEYEDWGRARAPDQVLRRGCNKYRFRYRVNPPAGEDWLAEIFLVNPDGTALGYQAYQTDTPDPDPRVGRGRFTICKNSTRFGRHKLRMKVTWYDREDAPHPGWVRPTYFRLMRP